MIQYFFSDQHQDLEPRETFTNDCWVNVESPTPAEIEYITAKFSLPKTYVTAALDDNEVPRLEGIAKRATADSPLMILIHYPKYTTSPLGYLAYTTYPISFILTKNAVITIANHPAGFIQNFIMNPSKHNLDTTKHETLILKIMWFVAHSYVNSLEKTGKDTERLERELTTATRNEQIYTIMAMQKTLITFNESMAGNQPVLEQIRTNEDYFETNDFHELNEAILNENSEAISMANQQTKVLEQYSNMVSAVVSNNLNGVMKVLTSITIILTIPTIIGGLYGMNVHIPGQNVEVAFGAIILMTVFLCLITIHILRRHDYF